jgi:uncharacterized membrane protein
VSSGEVQRRRSGGEIAAIVVTTVLTTVAGVALILGPLLIAAWWVAREGITAFTAVWITIAAVWTLLLVNAAVRSAETRGWIAVGLFGWLGVIATAAGRLRR